MDELRIQLLLEAIKVLNSDNDYELREVLKREVAREFGLLTSVIAQG
ncbi:hypothetical protein V7150_16085 [Neobacillus drentensis]